MKELLKAEDPTKDYNFGEITLGTVKSADGKFNNYYRLIKPMNFRCFPEISGYRLCLWGAAFTDGKEYLAGRNASLGNVYGTTRLCGFLSWITGVLRIRGLNLKKSDSRTMWSG